jgi:hypothetical protein
MLSAAGGILFPAWLFIALERAWQAAIAVVFARILALVAFLTVVTTPGQYELAVAIQGLIPIVAGLISLPFVVPIGFSGFRSVTRSRIAPASRCWHGSVHSSSGLVTLPVPLVGHLMAYGRRATSRQKFVSAARPFRVVLETFLPRWRITKHDPVKDRPHPALLIGLSRRDTWSLSIFFLRVFIVFLFGEEFSSAIPSFD